VRDKPRLLGSIVLTSPDKLEAEGWASFEHPQKEGFDHFIGPYWNKGSGIDRVMGLLVEKRHTNGHLGTVHGGVVSSFADIALGSGVVHALGNLSTGCATISLNMQFLAVAREGDFLTLQAEVTRQSRQLIFVRGLIMNGDKAIASAEGIWKLLDSAGKHKTPLDT